MKKSFELVEYEGQIILAVDGEAFDWGLEPADMNKMRFAVKRDEGVKDSFLGNVKHHFITCFADFLGRPIAFKEINEALDRGYIETEASQR